MNGGTLAEQIMPPRWRFADVLFLALVCAVAGGARAWYVSECSGQGRLTPALQVQGPGPPAPVPSWLGAQHKIRGKIRPTELDNLVENLSTDRGYGGFAPLAPAQPDQQEATPHVAPGYAWLFGWIGGWAETWEQADQWMRWLQVLLGTLTVAFYFCFARRVFHSGNVAALTGLLCALHPFWIVNTAELNDGVLATFLLAAALMLAVRAGDV